MTTLEYSERIFDPKYHGNGCLLEDPDEPREHLQTQLQTAKTPADAIQLKWPQAPREDIERFLKGMDRSLRREVLQLILNDGDLEPEDLNYSVDPYAVDDFDWVNIPDTQPDATINIFDADGADQHWHHPPAAVLGTETRGTWWLNEEDQPYASQNRLEHRLAEETGWLG
jgi:hypothetical protein